MASGGRKFVLWLHGLGDSGRANEPLRDRFTIPELAGTKWAFPTAPSAPVTCSNGAIMNSWFDVCNAPITSKSVKGLDDVLESVQRVHAIVDKEISEGTEPANIFVAGLSQGGAMAIASVLLYPNTLGGGAVFSGFLPFNSPIEDRISPQAKKTPILWCHGTLDSLVPFKAGEDGTEFLQKLGMSCKFKVYEGLGHSLDETELEYFQKWLKQQLQKSNKKPSHFPTCGLFSKFCSMASGERRIVIWLHGRGGSGPASKHFLKDRFTKPEFTGTKWAFPTAPSIPITCNGGAIMNSWFDVCRIPITSRSVKSLDDVLESVQKVHALVDKEISDGTEPANIFIAGFSQGGAMAIASVLLYPTTLGGAVVFSGFLPFNSPIEDRISPQAKKTPVLWCHGMLDSLVPFQAGEDGKEFLQKLGMSCKFKAYEGLGHELDEPELEYFETWFKQLKKSNKYSHYPSCS